MPASYSDREVPATIIVAVPTLLVYLLGVRAIELRELTSAAEQ